MKKKIEPIANVPMWDRGITMCSSCGDWVGVEEMTPVGECQDCLSKTIKKWRESSKRKRGTE